MLKIRHYAHRRTAAATKSWTGPAIASKYQFPAHKTGGPVQGIALIELGGGYNSSDVSSYFTSLNLPVPPVTFVSIGGATNSPDGVDGAQGEVMLDICVAGGVTGGLVPLYVVTAPNTTQGFVEAIQWAASSPNVSVVSISWGGPENNWDSADITSMNKAIQSCVAAKKTVFVASGDSGSTDGETGNHVDFPASSPYAVGCGGTKLLTSGTETVWNDGSAGGATGGGVSTLFAVPSFQPSAAISGKGRGVPDVAGNADPSTGYPVLIDGKSEVFGGTSAVAPLWAGLSALINQNLGKNVVLFGSTIYSLMSDFNDITSGNNGTYVAKVGYDLCTGLGTPNGLKLLAGLGSPVPVKASFNFTLSQNHAANTAFSITTPVSLPAGNYQISQV